MKSIRQTGQYDRTSVAGECVDAFVPFALPPQNPNFEVTDSVQSLLDNVESQLAKLEWAGQMVPSIDWFVYAYVRKEAVTSSQIEGTQATLVDLISFETQIEFEFVQNFDVQDICNYLKAIQYARKQLKSKTGIPLSVRLLNETHKRLMKGVRGGGKLPGEIRKSQNWIGGTRPGNAAFVPPPPHFLISLMSDFEKYIHSCDSIHPLIKIGFLHVQFETIHPYLDGNGRMGRLLMTLLFEEWGFLSEPLLYLSLYFKRNRKDYYYLLERVRTHGDWEAWIEFYLQGVAEVAQEAALLASHLSHMLQEDREQILNHEHSTLMTMKLFELLPTQPMITMPHVVDQLGVSKPSALKAISILEELDILKERTGKKRDRQYEYFDYLELLKVGTEL